MTDQNEDEVEQENRRKLEGEKKPLTLIYINEDFIDELCW